MSAAGPEPMDDAMDHALIDGDTVVDRYLMGRLAPDEAERFERHYLSCPRCLEQLEVGEQLIDGLRHAAVRDVERAGVAAALTVVLARLGRWRVPLAAAAATLLLLPAGLLYQKLGRVTGELEGLRARLGAPQVNLPLLSLSPLRGDPAGAEPAHRLRLGEASATVVLQLELELPPGSAWRAVLEDAAGEARWAGDGLVGDAAGNLVLGLPTALLPTGDHLLRVEDPDSGDPIARFALSVLPPR